MCKCPNWPGPTLLPYAKYECRTGKTQTKLETSSLAQRLKKLFPCSTQLSTKFILLINVKMPTIVGIFSFISMINTTSERLKARNCFNCRYFSFYEQLKFHAQLSSA